MITHIRLLLAALCLLAALSPAVQAACSGGVASWTTTQSVYTPSTGCQISQTANVALKFKVVFIDLGAPWNTDWVSSAYDCYFGDTCVSIYYQSAPVSVVNGVTYTDANVTSFDGKLNRVNNTSQCSFHSYVSDTENYTHRCYPDRSSCESEGNYWDFVGGPGYGGQCVDEGACDDQGLFWSFAPGTTDRICRDLYGIGDPACNEELTYYCGDIIPAIGCPYNYVTDAVCFSPILIDVAGDGFKLSSAARGVDFDIDGNSDHVKEHLSWPDSPDDAWLALDRDRNGRIDSGRELFGNATPQMTTTKRGGEANGFNALATFDTPEQGGNGDGVIDARDSFFKYLRLWQDVNRDGVSQPEELHTLAEMGIARLHFDDKPSKKIDEFGNEFRYRAKVDDARGAKAGRWAYDVYLKAR